MKRRSILFGMALVAALTTVPGSATAQAASAAAAAEQCFQRECDGKDPNKTTCSRAPLTPREQFFGHRYTLQLRYSPTCMALWARVIRDDCDINLTMHLRVQRQLVSTQDWFPAGTRYLVQSKVPCDGGVGWTYMVYNATGSKDRFRACFDTHRYTSSSQLPESAWNCTSWYTPS